MHLLLYAALVLGRQPAVMKAPAGHNLVLTAPMLHALERWNPTFRPWADRDYQPLLVRVYEFSKSAAPFAMLGDYNGDGRVDVAIHGRTRTRTVLLVILSNGAGYRVVVVKETPLIDPSKEWYGVGNKQVNYGLALFLRDLDPAGSTIGIDGPRRLLKYDAFEVELWEKASTAYVWDGRRFEAVLTGD